MTVIYIIQCSIFMLFKRSMQIFSNFAYSFVYRQQCSACRRHKRPEQRGYLKNKNRGSRGFIIIQLELLIVRKEWRSHYAVQKCVLKTLKPFLWHWNSIFQYCGTNFLETIRNIDMICFASTLYAPLSLELESLCTYLLFLLIKKNNYKIFTINKKTL